MKYDMDNSTDKACVFEYLDWKILPQNNPHHHTGSVWLGGEVVREFQIDPKEARAMVMEWMPDRMKTEREKKK
jgi:hypothetical protein|tara:strand:+ start:2819 stop:3037 length:219 start_codon:yes stop_codon:yes gene_type:complete